MEMPELITAFKSLGFKDVKTYLQSGNVIFTTSKRNKSELISLIQEKIKWVFNYPVSVVLISANKLQGIISTNPFLIDSEIDTKNLHITFLSERPTVSSLNRIEAMPGEQDKFVISGREVYLYCPNGYGRTRYSNAYFEKKLGTSATTRSWQTVVNLANMIKGGRNGPYRVS
jgi:uncharacterized protein (DUF1697 family)